MPWESKKQQRWGHSPAGKKELTEKQIKEFDSTTDFDSLPEEATAGKGPGRSQQGKQKKGPTIPNAGDPVVNRGGSGPHSSKKGKRGYTRKKKHKGGISESEELTPWDETYRGMNFPLASTLNWSLAYGPEDLSQARPCGEGEDPEQGHCNPNISPEQGGGGGVSMKDAQKQREAELGRPMDVNEFMSFKKEWEAGNPDQAAMKQRADEVRRQDTLEQIEEQKAADRAAYRQGKRDEKGLFDPPAPKTRPNPFKGTQFTQRDFDEMGPDEMDDLQRDLKRYGASVAADLNWSTHKSETFDDTGEKGGHPAWGLKSVIDRGVKPHEKPKGAKRIEDAEHQVTKREIPGKKFKSYSMVGAFNW